MSLKTLIIYQNENLFNILNELYSEEFKIIEETKQNQDYIKIEDLSKVSEIKDSLLNYNRLNQNLNLKMEN